MRKRRSDDSGRVSRQLTTVVLGIMLGLWGISCAGSSADAPQLLPLQPADVVVNQTLHLQLIVRNPNGVGLDYSFSGPELPGLTQVTSIAGTPSGGEFLWTPLASHVGTHQFTFMISYADGSHSQSVLITVSPASSAAPIFLRPGAGGTYDLARDPAVRFDIEVRDDDSSEVAIRLADSPPEGAGLASTGDKQARFEWLPTPEQIDKAERWTIHLEADDLDHDPTSHQYLVVLRSPGTGGCAGTPPTVTLVSPADHSRVTSQPGFPIVIQVTDDVGIRDAPLLYYTTTPPLDEADPDVTSFEQTSFVVSSDQFQTWVPAMGLAEGEERRVYFVVSVTDNDDPNGAACDHRTDTPLHQFIAVGASGTRKAEVCESCTVSLDCVTGVCATSASGARCLAACGYGEICEVGTCMATTTVEGATVDACGDVRVVCEGGGGDCSDDRYEPNNSFSEAEALTDATITAAICPGDDDYYRVDNSSSNDVDLTITVRDFDAEVVDLDLEVFDSSERQIANSAGIEAVETVQVCLFSETHAYLRVFGYAWNDSGDYTLHVDQIEGDCCINDANEPDDSIATARPVESGGLFEGIVCPGDIDYLRFSIDEPGWLEVTLLFESLTGSSADLDMKLYKQDGTYVTGAFSWSDEEETLITELAETGTYVLRIYSVYDDNAAQYLGEVVLEPQGG